MEANTKNNIKDFVRRTKFCINGKFMGFIIGNPE